MITKEKVGDSIVTREIWCGELIGRATVLIVMSKRCWNFQRPPTEGANERPHLLDMKVKGHTFCLKISRIRDDMGS